MLRAYENDPALPPPALLVFGPFMQPDRQAEFARPRRAGSPSVARITFDARLESLMARAAGVVAMGGYNTFCEILSFDKPALIVPRTAPRMEQFIRAQRAASSGSSRCCPTTAATTRDDGGGAAAAAAAAPPSEVVVPGLLDGLATSTGWPQTWLERRPAAARQPARAALRAVRRRLSADAAAHSAAVCRPASPSS